MGRCREALRVHARLSGLCVLLGYCEAGSSKLLRGGGGLEHGPCWIPSVILGGYRRMVMRLLTL